MTSSTPHHPDLVVGPDGVARCAWPGLAHGDYRDYHDREWGKPVHGEAALFERLCLEGFQAGLSWLVILRKRPAFRQAFAGFDPEVVAELTLADVEALMEDESIVRNRRKIEATIDGAKATLALRDEGGLADLVWSFRPKRTPRPRRASDIPTQSAESVALAAELKRRGFRFVGPTTAYALMSAIGMVDLHLMSSHRRGCSGLWPA